MGQHWPRGGAGRRHGAGSRGVGKAIATESNLARAHFFYAKVLRNDGNYDGAADQFAKFSPSIRETASPSTILAACCFCKRKYKDAIRTLQGVLAVDPEDLQAHYNLMLAYRDGRRKDGARARDPLSAIQGRRICPDDHRPLSAPQSRR